MRCGSGQGRRSRKPIVVSVNAGTMYSPFVEALEEGGVPTFATAERAMTALNRLVDHELGRVGAGPARAPGAGAPPPGA